MDEIKRVFKWWSVWDSERIEQWLEQMELQGWRPVSIKWGGLRFHFRKGTSRTVRYCADFQMKADANYKSLFEDSGWEEVFDSGGWHIWRMPYTEQRPHIYSDQQSLIERNRRLLIMLYCVMLAQIPLIMVNISTMKAYPLFVVIYVAVLGMLGYAIGRIHLANRHLENKVIH